MKQSSQEIEIDHNATDLFNIVLDIEKYPEFIPWCSKIQIINKKKNEIKAEMIVKYKLFPSQIFKSDVFFNNKNLIIKTKYVDGPLKDLESTWKFISLKKNKTKIIFKVEFEFKRYIHQKLAEFFFPLIENKMIDSFVKRAHQILN